MASTQEILAGSIALIIFTFVDMLLYVVGNSIMGPLIQIVNQFHITPLLGMSENTYVFFLLWAFLLLFEVAAIISFAYIVGRRQLNTSEII